MHLNGREEIRDIKCFAVTSTHSCSKRLHSIHLLSIRDLSYTNWDKNTYFAWFIGHKEKQETADFTSD